MDEAQPVAGSKLTEVKGVEDDAICQTTEPGLAVEEEGLVSVHLSLRPNEKAEHQPEPEDTVTESTEIEAVMENSGQDNNNTNSSREAHGSDIEKEICAQEAIIRSRTEEGCGGSAKTEPSPADDPEISADASLHTSEDGSILKTVLEQISLKEQEVTLQALKTPKRDLQPSKKAESEPGDNQQRQPAAFEAYRTISQEAEVEVKECINEAVTGKEESSMTLMGKGSAEPTAPSHCGGQHMVGALGASEAAEHTAASKVAVVSEVASEEQASEASCGFSVPSPERVDTSLAESTEFPNETAGNHISDSSLEIAQLALENEAEAASSLSDSKVSTCAIAASEEAAPDAEALGPTQEESSLYNKEAEGEGTAISIETASLSPDGFIVEGNASFPSTSTPASVDEDVDSLKSTPAPIDGTGEPEAALGESRVSDNKDWTPEDEESPVLVDDQCNLTENTAILTDETPPAPGTELDGAVKEDALACGEKAFVPLEEASVALKEDPAVSDKEESFIAVEEAANSLEGSPVITTQVHSSREEILLGGQEAPTPGQDVPYTEEFPAYTIKTSDVPPEAPLDTLATEEKAPGVSDEAGVSKEYSSTENATIAVEEANASTHVTENATAATLEASIALEEEALPGDHESANTEDLRGPLQDGTACAEEASVPVLTNEASDSLEETAVLGENVLPSGEDEIPGHGDQVNVPPTEDPAHEKVSLTSTNEEVSGTPEGNPIPLDDAPASGEKVDVSVDRALVSQEEISASTQNAPLSELDNCASPDEGASSKEGALASVESNTSFPTEASSPNEGACYVAEAASASATDAPKPLVDDPRFDEDDTSSSVKEAGSMEAASDGQVEIPAVVEDASPPQNEASNYLKEALVLEDDKAAVQKDESVSLLEDAAECEQSAISSAPVMEAPTPVEEASQKALHEVTIVEEGESASRDKADRILDEVTVLEGEASIPVEQSLVFIDGASAPSVLIPLPEEGPPSSDETSDPKDEASGTVEEAAGPTEGVPVSLEEASNLIEEAPCPSVKTAASSNEALESQAQSPIGHGSLATEAPSGCTLKADYARDQGQDPVDNAGSLMEKATTLLQESALLVDSPILTLDAGIPVDRAAPPTGRHEASLNMDKAVLPLGDAPVAVEGALSVDKVSLPPEEAPVSVESGLAPGEVLLEKASALSPSIHHEDAPVPTEEASTLLEEAGTTVEEVQAPTKEPLEASKLNEAPAPQSDDAGEAPLAFDPVGAVEQVPVLVEDASKSKEGITAPLEEASVSIEEVSLVPDEAPRTIEKVASAPETPVQAVKASPVREETSLSTNEASLLVEGSGLPVEEAKASRDEASKALRVDHAPVSAEITSADTEDGSVPIEATSASTEGEALVHNGKASFPKSPVLTEEAPVLEKEAALAIEEESLLVVEAGLPIETAPIGTEEALPPLSVDDAPASGVTTSTSPEEAPASIREDADSLEQAPVAADNGSAPKDEGSNSTEEPTRLVRDAGLNLESITGLTPEKAASLIEAPALLENTFASGDETPTALEERAVAAVSEDTRLIIEGASAGTDLDEDSGAVENSASADKGEAFAPSLEAEESCALTEEAREEASVYTEELSRRLENTGLTVERSASLPDAGTPVQDTTTLEEETPISSEEAGIATQEVAVLMDNAAPMIEHAPTATGEVVLNLDEVPTPGNSSSADAEEAQATNHEAGNDSTPKNDDALAEVEEPGVAVEKVDVSAEISVAGENSLTPSKGQETAAAVTEASFLAASADFIAEERPAPGENPSAKTEQVTSSTFQAASVLEQPSGFLEKPSVPKEEEGSQVEEVTVMEEASPIPNEAPVALEGIRAPKEEATSLLYQDAVAPEEASPVAEGVPTVEEVHASPVDNSFPAEAPSTVENAPAIIGEDFVTTFEAGAGVEQDPLPSPTASASMNDSDCCGVVTEEASIPVEETKSTVGEPATGTEKASSSAQEGPACSLHDVSVQEQEQEPLLGENMPAVKEEEAPAHLVDALPTEDTSVVVGEDAELIGKEAKAEDIAARETSASTLESVKAVEQAQDPNVEASAAEEAIAPGKDSTVLTKEPSLVPEKNSDIAAEDASSVDASALVVDSLASKEVHRPSEKEADVATVETANTFLSKSVDLADNGPAMSNQQAEAALEQAPTLRDIPPHNDEGERFPKEASLPLEKPLLSLEKPVENPTEVQTPGAVEDFSAPNEETRAAMEEEVSAALEEAAVAKEGASPVLQVEAELPQPGDLEEALHLGEAATHVETTPVVTEDATVAPLAGSFAAATPESSDAKEETPVLLDEGTRNEVEHVPSPMEKVAVRVEQALPVSGATTGASEEASTSLNGSSPLADDEVMAVLSLEATPPCPEEEPTNREKEEEAPVVEHPIQLSVKSVPKPSTPTGKVAPAAGEEMQESRAEEILHQVTKEIQDYAEGRLSSPKGRRHSITRRFSLTAHKEKRKEGGFRCTIM